jgi:hypothetical protein
VIVYVKQNLVKDKEISMLIFLYFLILNFWYNEISNNHVFDKLLKFEDENFYFIPYLTSVIFNSLKDFLSIEIIGYFSVVIVPTLIFFLTKRSLTKVHALIITITSPHCFVRSKNLYRVSLSNVFELKSF